MRRESVVKPGAVEAVADFLRRVRSMRRISARDRGEGLGEYAAWLPDRLANDRNMLGLICASKIVGQAAAEFGFDFERRLSRSRRPRKRSSTCSGVIG